MQPVMEALAVAGHEVVVYSPFPHPRPPPNYTDVLLENIKTESDEITNWLLRISQTQYTCFDAAWYIHEMMYREFFGDPKIKRLFASNEKFDLIITEAFTTQEFALLLSNKYKVTAISLQTFPTNHLLNSQSGNSLSMSFSPSLCTPFSDEMSFTERLINYVASLWDLYNYYNYLLKSLERMIKNDFPDAPPLDELIKSVSLTFVNDHLTADYAQPRTPNIIPVGGIHIQPPQPLPKGLKEFVDGAEYGVILFSLGTYVQDELQPQTYFDMYINVFKNLKQRVIWKTRKENILGLPKNVMTVKWAPQPDILAHPNCVLFITHGGLHSQHEAIHYGVPVVGIPQFFDQHRNVKYFEAQGVGIKIETKDLSEETISAAIQEVIKNKSYKENMQRLSAVFRDRPLSPAESVVFWTEYVLRHDGAAHLRPASTELRWYQLVLLDVSALILVIFIALFTIVFVILRSFYRFFRKRESNVISKKGN